jgi:hypothetical protein
MRNTKTLILVFIAITATTTGILAGQSGAVLWTDYDFRDIPEPKARSVGLYDSAFQTEFIAPVKRGTDIPHWVRAAAGSPKQASNVNALDEVPDSSWYTNRHALRHMTIEQLVRGPNRGAPPDFSNATITHAKLQGVTPGLEITDANGREYLVKFDNKNYPELQSGAEVVSTKILYATGYNVPENYIAFITPAKLKIKEGMEMSEGGKKHPFTGEDLAKMLKEVARRPDGSYRVLASKLLEGKPKGPFPYEGLRTDDPNDLIPHEHRRDLRGLRVIASWINHWDLKEQNTLDMYVEEGGRKFLRHYLIDFGSSLGGGKSPTEYFHGREYAFDKGNIFKELFTLGLTVTPDEKSAPINYPEVGLFSATDFDPGDWRTSFWTLPFANMTREDAFWATRIILAFSEEELSSIVKAGEYSNPKAAEYIVKTLIDRRRQIATYWLKDVNPVSYFAVNKNANGAELVFQDLLAANDLGFGAGEYRYQTARGEQWTQPQSTKMPRIPLGDVSGQMKIRIQTVRAGKASKPVILVVQSKPSGGYAIAEIDRS